MRRITILTLLCVAVAFTSCSQETTGPVPVTSDGEVNSAMPSAVRQLVDERITELLDGFPSMSLSPDNNISSARYHVYALVYLWGRLSNADVGPSITTDWTGMLTTTAVGHMQPIMGLFFEEGQDSLVPTDANIHIAWVSFTEDDFDGVAGLLFVDWEAVYITPPLLIFDTEPFYLELPISELDLFYGFYRVDNVNGVAVHTRRIFSNDCPGGFLDGEWVRDDNGGMSGSFHGLWLDHDGNPEGHFSGQFWTESSTIRRFSGELSGYESDEIIADLFGTWDYDDPRLCPTCGSSHGWFKGRYVYLDGTLYGNIKGVFGDYIQPPEENHLPLEGVWRQTCPWTFDPELESQLSLK